MTLLHLQVNQLQKSFHKRITNKTSAGTLTSLGLILLNPVINKIVDSTVTTDGLKLLLETGSVAKSSRTNFENPQFSWSH